VIHLPPLYTQQASNNGDILWNEAFAPVFFSDETLPDATTSQPTKQPEQNASRIKDSKRRKNKMKKMAMMNIRMTRNKTEPNEKEVNENDHKARQNKMKTKNKKMAL